MLGAIIIAVIRIQPQLSGHYHPCYAPNKIQVTFSASLKESLNCVRNLITYFGSFIKGMATQLGQMSLKAPLNDNGMYHIESTLK